MVARAAANCSLRRSASLRAPDTHSARPTLANNSTTSSQNATFSRRQRVTVFMGCGCQELAPGTRRGGRSPAPGRGNRREQKARGNRPRL